MKTTKVFNPFSLPVPQKTRLVAVALAALGTTAVLSGCGGGGSGGASKNGSPTLAVSPTPGPTAAAATTRGQVHFSIAWPSSLDAGASRGRLIPKSTQRIDLRFKASGTELTILNPATTSNGGNFTLRSDGGYNNNVLTVTRPLSTTKTNPALSDVTFDLPTGTYAAQADGFGNAAPTAGEPVIATASKTLTVAEGSTGSNLDIALASTIQSLVVSVTDPVTSAALTEVKVNGSAKVTAAAFDGASGAGKMILLAPGDVTYSIPDAVNATFSSNSATSVTSINDTAGNGSVLFTGKHSTFTLGNTSPVVVTAKVKTQDSPSDVYQTVTATVSVRPVISLPTLGRKDTADGDGNAIYQNGVATVSASVSGANSAAVEYSLVGYPVSVTVTSPTSSASTELTVPITGNTAPLNYGLSAKLLETGDTVTLPAFTVSGIVFSVSAANVNFGTLLQGASATFLPSLSGVKGTPTYTFATTLGSTPVSTTNLFPAPYGPTAIPGTPDTYATTATVTSIVVGGVAATLPDAPLSAAFTFSVPDVSVTSTSPANPVLAIGSAATSGTLPLNATATGALDSSVNWTVETPNTANFDVSVSATGLVTAVYKGATLVPPATVSEDFTVRATSTKRTDKIHDFTVTVTKQ